MWSDSKWLPSSVTVISCASQISLAAKYEQKRPVNGEERGGQATCKHPDPRWRFTAPPAVVPEVLIRILASVDPVPWFFPGLDLGFPWLSELMNPCSNYTFP